MKTLRVWKNDSRFNPNKPWYTATREDGTRATIEFVCEIPEDYKKMRVFDISNAKGVSHPREDYETEDGRTIKQQLIKVYACEFNEAIFDVDEDAFDDLEDIF